MCRRNVDDIPAYGEYEKQSPQYCDYDGPFQPDDGHEHAADHRHNGRWASSVGLNIGSGADAGPEQRTA